MNESLRFLRTAFQLIAGRFFDGFGAPVCPDIGKNRRAVRKQLLQQHRRRIERIVLRRKNIGLARSVPVESRIEQGFREVTVRIVIRPLSLSLETARDGVMSDHFLLTARRQILLAVEKVLDDAHHLDNELPVRVLLFAGPLQLFRILVESFLTVFFSPGKCFLILGLAVDTFIHAADDLDLVDGFDPHAEILFKEIRIDLGSCDPHRNGSDLQIGFASHRRGCHSGASEAEQLLLYIIRDLLCGRGLYVPAVDAECRQTFLCVSCQDRSQIYGTRALRPVESPYTLDRHRIHVHGL